MFGMEYVVGPVLALLISMKFTAWKTKPHVPKITHEELLATIEAVDKRLTTTETELPKKVMAIMMPVAKAVQKLNNEVGIQ